ncbi:hypothetical protein [Phenylobacterium sp.]|uniref:hypothetical protein n=1 Tax=Phenylobacterium sp. TaxID=1871053 RepID=UPI00374C8E36
MDAETLKSAATLLGGVGTFVGSVGGFLLGLRRGKISERNAHPTIYAYDNGRFCKDGKYWREYNKDGEQIFLFEEAGVSDGFQEIFDSRRDILVRFPINGGMSEYSTISDRRWRNIYNVLPLRI